VKKGIRNFLIFGEVVLLFGPATLLMLLSALFFLMFRDAFTMVTIVGGLFGLHSALHLAAHAISDTHLLPRKNLLFGGLILGGVTCIAGIVLVDSLPEVQLALSGPIIGALHLAWLCRDSIKNLE